MKGKLKALGAGTVLWFAAQTLVWLLAAKNYLDEYGYRFVTVTNAPAALASASFILLLPLILLLLAVSWRYDDEENRVCYVLTNDPESSPAR